MELSHHTPSSIIIEEIVKSLTKNLELKATILSKINSTYGSEQLSWIKKYNGLFVDNYTGKRK